MRLYLSAGPEEFQEAAAFQIPLARAAYRMGAASSLLSRDLLLSGTPPRGLLALSDRAAPPVDQPETLARAVLRECQRRELDGVALDFDLPPRTDLRRLASVLAQCLSTARKALYLPESYADTVERRIVIVNTAVSGGSFETHIQEVCDQYGGPQNVALDIQRLRMDFPLPAVTGEGAPLAPEALEALLQAHSPAVFFSRDLCARYFTYTQQGEARFVLFDDAGTLRQKLRLGQQLGVAAAFFQWPEIRDIATSLLRQV